MLLNLSFFPIKNRGVRKTETGPTKTSQRDNCREHHSTDIINMVVKKIPQGGIFLLT